MPDRYRTEWGYDLERVMALLAKATPENVDAFFERNLQYQCGISAVHPCRPAKDDKPDMFAIDVSAVVQQMNRMLEAYSSALCRLGFDNKAISLTLSKYYGTNTLPPFDRVLDEVISVASARTFAYRTLVHQDFEFIRTLPDDRPGGATESYASATKPTDLQSVILKHIFEAYAMQLGRPTGDRTNLLAGIILLATGLGKTFLSAFILRKHISINHKALCAASDRSSTKGFLKCKFLESFLWSQEVTLFLVNATFIRDQVYERYKEYMVDTFIEWEMREYVRQTGTHADPEGYYRFLRELFAKLAHEMFVNVQPDAGATAQPAALASINDGIERYARALYPTRVASEPEIKRRSAQWFSTSEFAGAVSHRFYFALFQSLHTIPAADIRNVTRLVVDEVHHIFAPMYYRSVTSILRNPNMTLSLGLTATLIHRNDPGALRIRELFGGNVFVNLPWYVAKELGLFPLVTYLEYTPECLGASYFLPYPAMVEKLRQGTIDARVFETFLYQTCAHADARMRVAQEESVRIPYAVRSLVSFTKERSPRRILAFLPTVDDVERFCSELRAAADGSDDSGPIEISSTDASTDSVQSTSGLATIAKTSSKCGIEVLRAHYRMKKREIGSAIERFNGPASGTIVLATVAMATEGYDMPSVDAVLLLRRTESERIFVQQMGRCLRKAPGKDRVFVLDFVYGLRSRWLRLYEDAAASDMDEVRTQILRFWGVECRG